VQQKAVSTSEVTCTGEAFGVGGRGEDDVPRYVGWGKSERVGCMGLGFGGEPSHTAVPSSGSIDK
jgi:hypothetical protein